MEDIIRICKHIIECMVDSDYKLLENRKYKCMCRMKGIIITFLFSVSLILFGCTYQPEYFSKEELEGCSTPIVFLKSAENEKNIL
ncbi:MAG: hypothetical protein HDQ97_02845 [Lachnospiraceae bacterium]|nr:hypothetical protein [Lachnospiraceae bacterium]